jgi:pilus assembly protein CpaE
MEFSRYDAASAAPQGAGGVAEAADGRPGLGRVFTVFSPKGGTGKTVLATNLAAALAGLEGRRTLLLDLDLQFGDAAVVLGMEPERTVADLMIAPGKLDGEKLASYTLSHPSGLELLSAPTRPEDAELVTETNLTQLLEIARERFDVIVVDTPPFFHGPTLATLDRTDVLLLLCGLDVPTLRNVRLSLRTLELLSFPGERVRVVLNRANSKVGLKPADVEAALATQIRFYLPSDRTVPLSVNQGRPAVLAEPRSEFARAIGELARTLAPSDGTTVSRGPRRLFRRRG